MIEPAKTDSTAERLKSFIERIECFEESRSEISEEIKDVFAEVKSHGFDVKIVRQVLKLRKLEPNERQEQEALLESYLSALGMFSATPLGRAAAERAP